MKTNLLKASALALVMSSYFSCTIESTNLSDPELVTDVTIIEPSLESALVCSGNNPRARITNNGTIPFDFVIFDTAGTLVQTEQNVLPGITTSWLTFPDGQFIFVIRNESFFGEKVSHFMDFCTEINLEVNVNNQLTDVLPQDASN